MKQFFISCEHGISIHQEDIISQDNVESKNKKKLWNHYSLLTRNSYSNQLAKNISQKHCKPISLQFIKLIGLPTLINISLH